MINYYYIMNRKNQFKFKLKIIIKIELNIPAGFFFF